MLLKIIRKIKKDITKQQSDRAITTAETVQGIRVAFPDKLQTELTTDDVSAAIAVYAGIINTMDESTSELLQQLEK